MKRHKLLLWMTGLFLLAAISCDRIDPYEKWKDITIVYGLINIHDSVQYIRVNKAFLGNDNAIHIAQNPDSSIYPIEDIDVIISEFDETGKEINVSLLDTALIANKDSGIFYYPYQIVYKLERAFEPLKTGNHTFRIDVTNKKTGKVVYAETPVVNPFVVGKPYANTSVDFIPTSNTMTFRWKTAKNGKRYDIYYTFYYGEAPAETYDLSLYRRDSVVWYIGSTLSYGNEAEVTYTFNPQAFYSALQKQIPYDPSVWRIANHTCKMEFWCGSNELYEYIQINNPATGIVQDRPEYTNLFSQIGDEKPKNRYDAFGLFSSRIRESYPVFLSPQMAKEYLPSEEYTNRQFVYFDSK